MNELMAWLDKTGFVVGHNSGAYNAFRMTPVVYRDNDKNLVITGDVIVSVMGGSGLAEDEIGCVTFYISGQRRMYKCRTTNPVRLFNESFVAKDTSDVIEKYKNWIVNARYLMKSWKRII